MGKTYYIDAQQGNDFSDGESPGSAWKSLSRAGQQSLSPGDTLLLKRGCQWDEPMTIRGSGEAGAPLTLATYGAGPKPRIVSDQSPLLGAEGPVSWWHIKGLELTGKRGFDPYGREQGAHQGIEFHQDSLSEGLKIEDCVIHDVDGAGITLRADALGATVFRDWSVIGCEVYNVGTGIATQGPWPPQGDATSTHAQFKVTQTLVHDTATDGIVLYFCQDGVIEHCKAWRTGLGRTPRTPVAIWYFLARRCVIQFCEAYDNHSAGGHADGGGFDLDGGCVDCVMQYNYSHDNDGAGLLLCSYDPVNAPVSGCVARFNLSVNDGRMNDYASIQFWQADDCQVYNNTCITRISSCLKFASETKGNLFANNLFVVDSSRDLPVIQTTHSLKGNRFEHNLFWRTGGSVSFLLPGGETFGFDELASRIGSLGGLNQDPELTAFSGPEVHLGLNSPARNAGVILKDIGSRDLYGVAIQENSSLSVGASLGLTCQKQVG